MQSCGVQVEELREGKVPIVWGEQGRPVQQLQMQLIGVGGLLGNGCRVLGWRMVLVVGVLFFGGGFCDRYMGFESVRKDGFWISRAPLDSFTCVIPV